MHELPSPRSRQIAIFAIVAQNSHEITRFLSARRLRRRADMGVYRVEDFAAYDFAVRFKEEVYRLIEQSPGASRNLEFRQQLEDAVSGIEGTMSEGFGRRRPREFALYLRYSLGSLHEARTRLQDGVQRSYFPQSACKQAVIWAERCKAATEALWRSQVRKAAEDERLAREERVKRKSNDRLEGKNPGHTSR